MSHRITNLLIRWRQGDDQAMNELMPLVYADLYSRARFYLNKERNNHTLTGTALVNEAWIKMLGQRRRSWECREHFYAIAAKIMKRILLQHAEKRNAKKRGVDYQIVGLSEYDPQSETVDREMLQLKDALDELEKKESRLALIVEFHYLVGMTTSEIGEILGASSASVKRDLVFARAYLRRFFKER